MNAPPENADEPVWQAYETALRSLLERTRPPRLQKAVDAALEQARELARRGAPARDALAEVYQRAAEQTLAQLRRPENSFRRLEPLLRRQLSRPPKPGEPDFHCDAALGGVARWLRGAGYDARWWPGIDDDVLVGKVLDSSAILLTTDRPLCRRGVVAQGVIPALLVPVTLCRREQFAYVMTQLDLPRKSPRCMACGGRLRPVAKLAVRERIPPRTYPWIDDYFLCQRCDKLFWRGTHWQQIERELSQLAGGQVARTEPT